MNTLCHIYVMIDSIIRCHVDWFITFTHHAMHQSILILSRAAFLRGKTASEFSINIIIYKMTRVAHARHSLEGSTQSSIYYPCYTHETSGRQLRLAQWSYKHQVCLATSSCAYPTGTEKQGFEYDARVYVYSSTNKKSRNYVTVSLRHSWQRYIYNIASRTHLRSSVLPWTCFEI